MINDKWGVKRNCHECVTAFYDMKREKIICPKCGTPWHAAVPSGPSAVARGAMVAGVAKVVTLPIEEFAVSMGSLKPMAAQDLDDLYGDLLDSDFSADEIRDVSEVMQSEYFYKD